MNNALYAAFGETWASDLPLPHFDLAEGESVDAIRVRRVATLPPRDAIATVNNGLVHDEGFRFAWRDEIVFDMQGGTQIDYLPGAGWTGAMPAAFYSTVAALTLAWRGALPCHASAVEIDGRAILIAGAAGAGKSTLTAALLERDARLIADDLTIVRRVAADGGFVACRGRPGIRLHADTAQRLPALDRHPVPDDDRGKWLARPNARTRYAAVPLAGIVLLGEPSGAIPRRDGAILLGPHLFRPRWLAALPDHGGRLRTMLSIAHEIPCRGLDPGAGFHRDPAAIERATRVIADLLA